jgi:hypothetical protein
VSCTTLAGVAESDHTLKPHLSPLELRLCLRTRLRLALERLDARPQRLRLRGRLRLPRLRGGRVRRHRLARRGCVCLRRRHLPAPRLELLGQILREVARLADVARLRVAVLRHGGQLLLQRRDLIAQCCDGRFLRAQPRGLRVERRGARLRVGERGR